MKGNSYLAESIDNLIRINSERMASFDKASQVTKDEQLKNYFEARADESEKNIQQLEALVPQSGSSLKTYGEYFLTACRMFDNAITGKKMNIIIDSARCVEKHMLEWYIKVVDGLSNTPAEFALLLQGQVERLKNGQLQLKHLTAHN
ncbi:MAG: DUF2383 domain-containing protein [Chitinophagaceae bacterium]|nr:DUF2383 domain-containing protein [Chitinophagaceae bacterium]